MNEKFQGTRVLVVEDEFLIFMMLEDMLSDLGATVAGHATSVSEGLALVERGGFDIAILDLNLDGAKVFPVAEALERRGVAFVFASGYGSVALDEHFAGHTCVDKPYQLEDISKALSAAMPVTR